MNQSSVIHEVRANGTERLVIECQRSLLDWLLARDPVKEFVRVGDIWYQRRDMSLANVSQQQEIHRALSLFF